MNIFRNQILVDLIKMEKPSFYKMQMKLQGNTEIDPTHLSSRS